MGPQALPTGVYGPLPSGTVGLLLGRSSWSLKGLQVLPGVIDADYTGEIKIMVNSPTCVTTVPSGSRIAQLVLIPSVAVGKVMNTEGRGDQGFGSSDVYWMQPVGEQRPTLALRVNGKTFHGILDTGADVSVISERHWPTRWPKKEAISALQGIGQAQSPYQSSAMLTWEDNEGHRGQFQPYILPRLPVNLWGRDVMKEMGVYLYSPSQATSHMLMNQGLLPDQGLGVHSQGNREPVQVVWRDPLDKRGLGHF